MNVVVVAAVESPNVTVTLKLPSGTFAENINGLSLVVVPPAVTHCDLGAGFVAITGRIRVKGRRSNQRVPRPGWAGAKVELPIDGRCLRSGRRRSLGRGHD